MPKIHGKGLISRRTFRRRVNELLNSQASNSSNETHDGILQQHIPAAENAIASASAIVISTENNIDCDVNIVSAGSVSTEKRSAVKPSISVQQMPINDDEDGTVPCDVESVREQLKCWALNHSIKHTAINDLLDIVRNIGGGVVDLPKDARSLLETPTLIKTKRVPPGEYWHRGVENAITESLLGANIPIELNTIKLQISVDGLPVSNSSKGQFWPILGKVNNLIDTPFVIGIYYGHAKPDSVQDYLRCFVDETKILLERGIMYCGKTFKLSIECIICDAPARAFMKGIISHNGYCGCEKCCIVGEYSYTSGHVTYIGTTSPLRTDETFRARSQQKHHKFTSPLEELPINMVDDFVLDYMHLLLPGIQKCLLKMWMKGTASFKTKFSSRDMAVISKLIDTTNDNLPREIHRSSRSLDVVGFWKATEFRTFLLKTGPVVLQDILPLEAYNHFMLLHCAVTICSCELFLKYSEIAEKLFLEFVETFPDIYGEENVTYTVHSLIHVMKDVKKFGTLDSYSAFSFESKLGEIKSLLRSGHKPFQQVAKRIMELTAIDRKKPNTTTNVLKKMQDENHNIPGCKGVYLEIHLSGMVLSSSCQNRWILTKCNEIVKIINFTVLDQDIYI